MANTNNKYRFGISLLSKDRYKNAYNEEVMIDKQTGQILIKTPELNHGDIISYDYNSRITSHITTIKSIANNVSVYGDIVSINFNDDVTPFIMEYSKNHITTPIDIMYNNCKKAIFHADIDAITVNSNGISYARNNMLVEMELSLIYTDNMISDPTVISCPLNEFNNKVLFLNNNSLFVVPPYKNIIGIRVSSFKIFDSVMDYGGNSIETSNTIRPIFNSLFAVIETI